MSKSEIVNEENNIIDVDFKAPETAPAEEVEKTLGDPVKLVRIAGHIPAERKSLFITEDHFEVPIIEATMFYHEHQFSRDQMDQVLTMSKNVFAPMIGYVCKVEDMEKGVEAIKAYYKSKLFAEAIAQYEEGTSKKAEIQDTKKILVDIAADYAKKRSRLVEIKDIVAGGRDVRENITGMTEEDLQAATSVTDKGDREQRRAAKKASGKTEK